MNSTLFTGDNELNVLNFHNDIAIKMREKISDIVYHTDDELFCTKKREHKITFLDRRPAYQNALEARQDSRTKSIPKSASMRNPVRPLLRRIPSLGKADRREPIIAIVKSCIKNVETRTEGKLTHLQNMITFQTERIKKLEYMIRQTERRDHMKNAELVKMRARIEELEHRERFRKLMYAEDCMSSLV